MRKATNSFHYFKLLLLLLFFLHIIINAAGMNFFILFVPLTAFQSFIFAYLIIQLFDASLKSFGSTKFPLTGNDLFTMEHLSRASSTPNVKEKYESSFMVKMIKMMQHLIRLCLTNGMRF